MVLCVYNYNDQVSTFIKNSTARSIQKIYRYLEMSESLYGFSYLREYI